MCMCVTLYCARPYEFNFPIVYEFNGGRLSSLQNIIIIIVLALNY